jgi:hypothetical protein
VAADLTVKSGANDVRGPGSRPPHIAGDPFDFPVGKKTLDAKPTTWRIAAAAYLTTIAGKSPVGVTVSGDIVIIK